MFATIFQNLILRMINVQYAHVNDKVQITVLYVLSISEDVIPSVKSITTENIKSTISISKRNYESSREII